MPRRPRKPVLLLGTFNEIKRNAARRELSFRVTLEYLEFLFSKQGGRCALSGLKITLPLNGTKKERDNSTASLDRINNKRGYLKNNVQWVHKDINKMKYIYKESYFIKMCQEIAKNNR